VHECGRAEFGDERLTQRFIKVVSALAEHPEASLVQATESWGEAKGIYRFFKQRPGSSTTRLPAPCS